MSGWVTDFDSASATVRALARCLQGRPFDHLGALSAPARAVVRASSLLPRPARDGLYRWSGWARAVSPRRLSGLRAEELAQWAVAHYVEPRYPALLIGSSGGLAAHLGAALAAPWLPQTVLVSVRRPGMAVGDGRRDLEWGARVAPPLLAANPELGLHHMHDPNQDALMIRHMTYFRLKRLRLGEAYRRFIAERLEPGAPVIVLDCGQLWPATSVGERHVFQFGAVGGLPPAGYRGGGPGERWRMPAPDHAAPEAEWGFDGALLDDVVAAAGAAGHPVHRLAFPTPAESGALAARLYRAWYRRHGLPTDRLLAESFIVMDPHHTLRTGSIPFWLTFNTETDAAALEAHLAAVAPYREIALTLFSHGTGSRGLASIHRWAGLVGQATGRGALAGVDRRRYPHDFATYARYGAALAAIASRPRPPRLGSAELTELLAEAAGGVTVWERLA